MEHEGFNEHFLRIRRQKAFSPHMPTYHFVPPANLMNDPNGVIRWGNEYHLFYQYNPYGAFHDTKHWGHAVSKDLVTWRDLPIALTPTPHSPDSSGCWSGSAINWNGTPAVMYTGVQGVHSEIQTQCIAISDDGLISWKKHFGNPVISEVPQIARQTRNFRDPYIFEDEDGWSVLLGSQILEQGGALFLYHSKDLFNWEYKGSLLTGNESETGSPWECPNLLKIGDKHVLIFSSLNPYKRVFYHIGRYENFQFTSESTGLLDFGVMYAPLAFNDLDGRHLMYGWIQEERPSDIQKIIGWSGAMTLPRQLSLKDKRLIQRVPKEVEQLRNEHHHFDYSKETRLEETTELSVAGRSLEMRTVIHPPLQGKLTFRVLCHSEKLEYTDIILDFTERQLYVEREQSSLDPDVRKHCQQMSLASLTDENWTLHFFIDHSVIEIIINEHLSLTARLYPTLPQSNRLFLISEGQHNPVRTIDVWVMKSIWSDLFDTDQKRANYSK